MVNLHLGAKAVAAGSFLRLLALRELSQLSSAASATRRLPRCHNVAFLSSHQQHERTAGAAAPIYSKKGPLFAAPIHRRRRPSNNCRSSSTSFLSSSRRPMSSSTSSSSRQQKPAATAAVIPRAAVSVCVQLCRQRGKGGTVGGPLSTESSIGNGSTRCHIRYRYLLVQRGKEPNKGMWSLPGGKLEYGETTLDGARRELAEEVEWDGGCGAGGGTAAGGGVNASSSPSSTAVAASTREASLLWHPNIVCATDSIGEGYHYLIAHCFARLQLGEGEVGEELTLPSVKGTDDAADAGWFTLSEIDAKCDSGEATPGVLEVIQRIEELSDKGLLPTTEIQ